MILAKERADNIKKYLEKELNETEEIDLRAGCCAKIIAPIPKIVVMTARIMDVL